MEDINRDIYKQIGAKVMDKEFGDAQHAFFEKHMGEFVEDDENKLEYTQIHDQYIALLEQIIATDLGEKYSEEQIDAFYLAFKDNLEMFEKEDGWAYDTLWGLINFDKFKQQILTYKKDNSALTKKEETTIENKGEADYYKYDAEDVNDPNNKWVKKMSKVEKGYSYDIW